MPNEPVEIKTSIPAQNLATRLGLRPLPDLDLATRIVPIIDVGAGAGGAGGALTLVDTTAINGFSSPLAAGQYRAGNANLGAGTTELIVDIPAASQFRLKFSGENNTATDDLEFKLVKAGTATRVAQWRMSGALFAWYETPLLSYLDGDLDLIVEKGGAGTSMVSFSIELVSR